MKIEKHPKSPTEYSLGVQEQFKAACQEQGAWCRFDAIQLQGRKGPRRGPGLEYARRFRRSLETWGQLAKVMFPGYHGKLRVQFREHPDGILAEGSARVAVQVRVGMSLRDIMGAVDEVIPTEAVVGLEAEDDRRKEITLPGGYTFTIRDGPDEL